MVKPIEFLKLRATEHQLITNTSLPPTVRQNMFSKTSFITWSVIAVQLIAVICEATVTYFGFKLVLCEPCGFFCTILRSLPRVNAQLQLECEISLKETYPFCPAVVSM